MQRIPLTAQGAKWMKEELKRLKTVERPQVIAAIAEARSHGDLSENAEYDAAKEKQGFIESKIKEYEYKLSLAQVIDPKEFSAEGKVVFGATVTIEDLGDEERFTYQIVGEDEADIKHAKISVLSPLARGLIGKEKGEVFELETPNGMREIEVVQIEYL